ncbi:MAG: zinc ribbon domain-containing protein [Lachnospiraceae bacterium]|nr:zinc ribbon domain-containing protein [Lachnospiraceae bacterium]
MFCNQCGNQLADGELFCPKCGAKQDPLVGAAASAAAPTPAQAPTSAAAPTPAQAPTPAAAPTPAQAAAAPAQAVGGANAPKKDAKKTLPFIIAGAAAAVVVLAILLIGVLPRVIGKGGKADRYDEKTVVGFAYTSEGDLFFNLQGDTYEVEDDVSHSTTSADLSVVAYTVWEDRSDTYDLYYITSDLKPVLVEEDVYYSVNVSYDGSYIAYLTDMNRDGTGGDLYLYSTKSNKSTLIDSEVYPDYICLSPGGTAVSYLKDYEGYSDNHLYIGGIKIKSEKVDKDGSVPVAVSDNGKALYYVTDNRKLYLYNGKDSVKLASDVDRSFYFNRNITEMLYVKDGKTYYYASKMSEPVKVVSADLYRVVTPDDVVVGYNNYSQIVGWDSLKGCVLQTYGGLYWLNKKGTDTVRIADPDTYQISADGKSLLYQSGRKIYKISKFNEDMNAKVVFSDNDLSGFVASGNLSKVYAIIDDELHYVKSETKTERISNDLSTYNYYSVVVYNDNMDKVFFIEDDALCYAGTTAKSKTEVEEEVDRIQKVINGIAYIVTDDGESTYYYMKNKEAIELYTY